MKKFLTKSGNSWVMTFTRTLLELLELNPEAEQVEIEVEGKTLKISKAKKDEEN